MDLKQTPPPPVSGDPQPRNPEPKFSTDRALNMAILVLGLVVAAYLVFIDDVFSFAFLVLAFTALMIISWCFDACAKSPERPFEGMWSEVAVWSLVASVAAVFVFMFPAAAASELMSPTAVLYAQHLVTFSVSLFCSAFCYRVSKKRAAAAAAAAMKLYPEIIYELHSVEHRLHQPASLEF
ncbi:hypothetical protein M6B38_202935 [Iris pallida]|uniref:Uncharacterized protein n=1 Tax=Iris pallida TaxID=29817 RepID=A0AAX6E8Q2_IRIPA|nr:hypothetical protein M6B38_202935 [Iris pallida]